MYLSKTFVKASIMTLLSLAATGAFAGELNLQGTASGYFNASGTTLGGLTYVGSTFNTTTSGGFYALGGDAGIVNVNNLGSMGLNGSTFNYAGDKFTLNVNFTEPTGITGSSTANFTATMIGNVSNTANGGVDVIFSGAPQTFNYSNASMTGSFSLAVNNLAIHPNQNESITGYGTGTCTPEPGAYAALGMGVLGFVVRRRRRK